MGLFENRNKSEESLSCQTRSLMEEVVSLTKMVEGLAERLALLELTAHKKDYRLIKEESIAKMFYPYPYLTFEQEVNKAIADGYSLELATKKHQIWIKEGK